MKKSFAIHINGLVQGVGFRPFIYNLAQQMQLAGYVDNSTNGVDIEILATQKELDSFINAINKDKPTVAVIEKINITELSSKENYNGFVIKPSVFTEGQITRVSADIAVCEHCMDDFKSQRRRVNYPLVNCTNCGPRFSIVRNIPYDRCNTTMSNYIMCNSCEKEYNNPIDRRFHAQPIACNNCGPQYFGIMGKLGGINKNIYNSKDYSQILENAIKILKSGGVLALKGIGGFVWIVDALNDNAVNKLRDIKHRYVKPFAVMCNNDEWIKKFVKIDNIEYEALTSWRRPIVILDELEKINNNINGNLNTIGVMFPYIPFHYDLFEKGNFNLLVVTSANEPDYPMVIDNEMAFGYILDNSHYLVWNNRDIFNRVDDSVLRIINNNQQLFRRARGYVPEPYIDTNNTDGGVAFGAHITSAFAIGRNNQILLSQYIGELEDYDAQKSFNEALENFSKLFLFKPTYVIADMHPSYYSSIKAREYSENNLVPLYKVQHHHAHAVSVMVEYKLNEDVYAFCFDGSGYGLDTMSWGGEILKCSRTNFERLYHLPYVALPGGDIASKECWRMAVSYIMNEFKGNGQVIIDRLGLKDRVGDKLLRDVVLLINSPLQKFYTSSVGRLFDAVSSILGICDKNSFQGEAAVLLESLGSSVNGNDIKELYYDSILKGVINDFLSGVSVTIISYKFHFNLANLFVSNLLRLSNGSEIKKVVLSGGVFQNKLLTEIVICLLKDNGFEPYYSVKVPCNDGGLAVGQLAAVAALRSIKN